MRNEDSSGEDAQAPANMPAPPDERDTQVIQEVLDIEQQRIDRDNRKTALFDKALDVEDAENQRHFTYETETRNAHLQLQRDQLQFQHKVVWTLLGLMVVVVLSLLGLVAFGSDAQHERAAAMGTPLFIGLAGYGVITALRRAFNSLTRR